MTDPSPSDPSRRSDDSAKWEPEQGDPFKGNGYDRAESAVDETLRAGLDRHGETWRTPLGFAFDLVLNFLFPRRR